MSVWVLALEVDRTASGEPIIEYWTGRQGSHGGPSRSPFKADAMRFHDARSAYECADTHRELRASEDWRVIHLTDPTNPGRGA